jgi:glycosyltransferase involved in cell wall biosynthesis
MVVPAGVTWELLVVNNRCTDETSSVVSAYLKELPIREIVEDKAGKSNAANRAVDESKGELLLWTDDDVEVDENWLSNMHSAYIRHDAGMLFGRVLPLWEVATADWYSPKTASLLACLDLGDRELVTKDSGFGVNYAFPRSVFPRIGPFDTNLGPLGSTGFGGEDTTIFMNAHNQGLRVVYCPSAIVNHRVPPERCSKEYHRNRVERSIGQFHKLVNNQYPNAKRLFGIPGFLYRALIFEILQLIYASVIRRKDRVMHAEMRIWRFKCLWNYTNSKRQADISP